MTPFKDGDAPREPTLEELANALEKGTTTSRALVEQCLARIKDPAGQGAATFISVDESGALAQADAADGLRRASAAPSRFAGIPVSIKDLFDVRGQVTKAGSLALADAAPAERDALVVSRLRRAGFVLIGRTNMSEFAFSGLGLNPHYGAPHNPWDRAHPRAPGGSSSGAAISVTDGMAHAALGTDTGGSCRIPAAFSGLTGFKPTASRVPTDGAFPLSTTLDSVGPLARTVGCCEVIDAFISGRDIASGSQATAPERIRLALVRNYVVENVDASVAAAVNRAISKLSAAGFVFKDVTISALADLPSINAKGGFSGAEAYGLHRSLLAAKGEIYDPRIRARILRGAEQSAADYIDLQERRRAFIASVTFDLEGFDAAIMPTTPIVAPEIAALQVDEQFVASNMLALRNPSIVNMLNGCAASLPVHQPGEAPVGLTVFGLGGADARIMQIAKTIELELKRP